MTEVIGTKLTICSGSRATKFVPSMYVLLEDDVAAHVIDCLYSDKNMPLRYILSGVWRNQASCLYGFLTYCAQVEEMNIPSFGIVAVSDGDIEDKDIQSSITGAIRGDHKNIEQEKIARKIADCTTQFNLSDRPRGVKGHPEYNHKKWLEEITLEMILSENSKVHTGFITEQRHISSLLELIEFSKSITDSHKGIKIGKSKSNYHNYYDIIKDDFRASNTDHKMNHIHWYILSCIKHYNPGRWNSYVKDVRDKIDETYKDHQQRFMDSDFDFR